MENFIWTQSISSICKSLKTDIIQGLDPKESARRLQTYGENRLPRKGGVVWWKLLLSQFSSIIIWLLLGAAIIAGLLGEMIDFWSILAIVIFNAVLGFLQEFRAEHSLEELQKLSSSFSKVIRGGKLQHIASEYIVPGDIILLEAGDRVPADGRIINVSRMAVEEASLTGESIPVSKHKETLQGNLHVGDRKNMVFMGTNVIRGKGYILVTQTALSTEIGKIATHLMQQKKEETPLHKQLDILGKKLVFICLGIVAVVFILGLLRGNSFIDMLLISLSLAVAAIPEGLPAAVTIALSIGVRKMVKKKALVRRLSSVETLGSTSVICTDKTGTLTQSVMTVRTLWVDQKWITVTGIGYTPKGEFDIISKDLDVALQIAVLCNNASILKKEEDEKETWNIIGDPTEGALLTAAAKRGFSKEKIEREYPFIEEIPFDSERKMMSVLREDKGREKLFVKGAPDVLLQRSKKWLIDGKELPINKEEIDAANATLASKAFRVLAVAYQTNMQAPLEEDLVFVGLIAMYDPPRKEVKEAIAKCKQAGVTTVMVTGDHKKTALAIAKELEMDADGACAKRACDGMELEKMSDAELENMTVFSRISANHKLRIVKAFQKSGHITAMTGDGVNDAPSLQAADIGIAMGITGTDVTKSSSDMIILDDNFASIVSAIEQGRGIYDNIVKFVSYLLSSNIAEILVIFIVMILGIVGPEGNSFIPLLPVQLLWINLVTDGFPAISLAMDPVAPYAMQRKPRPKSKEILNKRFVFFIFSISIIVTLGALTACFWGLKQSTSVAQTMTFTTLIILELIRVQMIRKQYKMKLFSNHYLLWALGSSLLLQLIVLYIPGLQIVFGTVPLKVVDWGIISGIAFILWWVGLFLTRLFYKNPAKG